MYTIDLVNCRFELYKYWFDSNKAVVTYRPNFVLEFKSKTIIMMKTILITGASNGIGKATAKRFSAEGWNVIATMRSPEKEQELINLNNVLVTSLDVEDIQSIKLAIELGIRKFGTIDTVLNNAGFGVFGPFELSTSEQIIKQFDVNVFGLMNVIKEILPHFRANHSGTIINVSSQGGRVTFPTGSLYHATKFALEGFSESLSYELLSQNIIVKIIEPGSTKTNFMSSVTIAENQDIKAYDQFNEAAMEQWNKNDTMQSTVEEIAEVIFAAATDGKNQLRYMAGADTALYFKARQGQTDQGYVNYMRNRFIPEIQESLN
jgi:NAD(P)-dependent dehydrogenase (short-subunit alcohol dehydrogenase family)